MKDFPISRRTFVGGAVAAGFAPAIIRPARAAGRTLKLGHLANEENSWHKASLKFAEEVKNRTNGEVEVQVFPNEQLGKETDLIKGIQLGTVDFTITGESLQNWTPYASLLATPYAIRDLDQMKTVVDGPIGEKIAAAVRDKAKLVPLTWFARGPRELTSNTPIKTPADLAGLKMRVPNVPLFVSFWTALGAKPTPMAFSEVFTALQSHVIDAQENPLALIRSASFNEVQKYTNLTDHVLSWIYLATGEHTLRKLTPDQQKALRDAAKVAQDYERELFLADEKRFRSELEKGGMTFVEVDKKAFAEKGSQAVLASLNPEVVPLYKEIVAAK
ncbi:tripartite ATP-independent transporter solute receptor, DctP family [Faunimonas pinastri]|uniref:Tripartite ATP-independent transporter solute receptor, DctP family n=1 Tax=Faunimonas pinastri TaxID=1855383 RepID=A0A1H9B3L6_9HYPH|nr:TRAP transporter substrate-binding protein [Faunimonas pinastri]SEP83554.1 tripartite ATP-independent transporter solute receptor, DctP family [Faunimonas pinastri]